MTSEAQRIAIAEACGIISKDQWGPLYKTPQGILRDCPDYLTDLNAMHEAEKVLDEQQAFNYHLYLEGCCKFGSAAGFWTYHATPHRRAEAFLRTIGKWEGAK